MGLQQRGPARINSLGLTQSEGLNFAISMYRYDQIKDTFKWYAIG